MNYQELLRSPIIPPQVATFIQKAANHISPVLIQGEQGTGKERIAKIIHYTGNWRGYHFYKFDCRILIEDTFHVQLSNLFRETHYGTIPATLYLEEIGSLRHNGQLMLSELIEDGMWQDGSDKKMVKNIRLIASSSENLKEKVAQGKFSDDLYHQLSALSIFVPPLRDRVKEISTIAQFILEEESKRMNIKRVEISNDILKLFESYWWPGNLRELEHVIKRSVIFSNGGNLLGKDLCLPMEDDYSSFFSFLKKAEIETSPPGRKSFRDGQESHLISTFFIELVHRIKNPLVSIKTFTQLLRERFGDEEFRDQFYRVVTEDIEKIDSLLNGLLNYIKIDTPIEKTNTVHVLLEEVLENHQPQMKDKQIKIFRKYEPNLPEAIIHEEQLRYVLTSILQYTLSFVPPMGSIGFLTKSSTTPKELNVHRVPLKDHGGYVEIIVVFTGYQKPTNPVKSVLGIPGFEQEGGIELELRLMKEIIQKNQGVVNFEVNEKKSKAIISLRLPIERRKVVYYPSTGS